MPFFLQLDPANREFNRNILIILSIQWLIMVAALTAITLSLKSSENTPVHVVQRVRKPELFPPPEPEPVPYVQKKLPKNATNRDQAQTIDWAYSPMHLTKLAEFEANLYEQFGDASEFLDFESEKFSKAFMEMDRWIHDYSVLHSAIGAHVNKLDIICSHPYLSLRMMKRFSRLYDVVANHSLEGAVRTYDFYMEIKKFGTEYRLPMQEDIEAMMLSILELQYIYGFKPYELCHGIFGKISTGHALTLEEAYEIGIFAKKLKMFPEALFWLENVYTDVERNPALATARVTNVTVLKVLVELTREHDESVDSLTLAKDYPHSNRFKHKIMSTKPLLTIKDANRLQFLKTGQADTDDLTPAYSELCIGREFQAKKVRSKLTCWYEHKSDAAWLIGPLKFEARSLDPYIVEIYDVFENKLINDLLDLAKPKIGRPLTSISDNINKQLYSNITAFRACSVALLSENDPGNGDLLASIDRKIQRIAQLETTNNNLDPTYDGNEPILVGSHAFGRQFSPNIDSFSGHGTVATEPTLQDRVMSTFIFYLNHVQYGGYTVFPAAGITVVPKKGSALVFDNVYKNGATNNKTVHAECPVIFGQKWVASKWLRWKKIQKGSTYSLNSWK